MESTIEGGGRLRLQVRMPAIRSSDPNDVIARLGIGEARMTPWQAGIEAAYEGFDERVVYVTPAMDGRVLVAGHRSSPPSGILRKTEPNFPPSLLRSVPRFCTVVQYFGIIV